jgi:hypothetical protein
LVVAGPPGRATAGLAMCTRAWQSAAASWTARRGVRAGLQSAGDDLLP